MNITWMNSTAVAGDRIAVIGLGNPLMGDDGFGLAALARLQEQWMLDPCVDVVDGGTWGLNLLPVLEAHDSVLLLDAIRAGEAPGTVVMLGGEEVPRRLSTKLSPHQIDLREILALAELRGALPQRLVAIGVEPAMVDLEAGLSPAVEKALQPVVVLAADRLSAWGASCEPLSLAVG